MSTVSVIITCYNYGKYINECINSVLSQTYTDFEIVIVNDGSTDEHTIKVLGEILHEKIKIINQANAGLPTARNIGIANSTGEFILPLDADDKLDPTFIEKTLEIALKNEKIGVVYTDQYYFGEEEKILTMKDFNFEDLLSQNHISVCSLVRRESYNDVKNKNKFGYNPNMIYGYEDWDLWISIAELGWEIKCLHEPLFFYRKRNGSMLSRAEKNHEYLINQLIENHKETYQQNFKQALLKIHKQYIDKEITLKDISKDMQNNKWLIKRLIKNLFSK